MTEERYPPEPEIITQHPLSQDLIDADAVKIVRRLAKHGYETYLVGGCVRDLVLGIVPKDFDVATSATPREIKATFRNCRVIGRRFRLCHIFFQEKIIEVATFRTEPLAKLEEDAPLAAIKAEKETQQEQEALARPARKPLAPRPDAPLRADAGPRADAPRTDVPRVAPSPRLPSVPAPQPVPVPASAPVLAPVPAPAPAAPPKKASEVHYFTGPRAEEVDGFSAGLFDDAAVAAPTPADAPLVSAVTVATPEPYPAPPQPIAAVAAPSPLAADLAPWEAEEEATTRERAALEGRRARAREEASEAIEADGAASGAFEGPRDGGRRDEGGRPDDRERPRRDGPAREGDEGRPRERRRARWEKLMDEDPPQGYGTADEDASLRDFTINALFYDVEGDRIIDYVGGMRDLKARLIKIIGIPEKRVAEDPVRILRGVKQAARLRLEIDGPTWAAFVSQAPTLETCSPRRILEEVLKLLASGSSGECFRLIVRAGALRYVLPELAPHLSAADAPTYRMLDALDRVDKERLSPEVMVAALFYHAVREAWAAAGLGRPGDAGFEGGRGGREAEAEAVADLVLQSFSARGSLSKKTRYDALRIMLAQRLLRRPIGKRMRAAKLVTRDWFDAALVLLEITVAAEGADREVIDCWTSRADAVRSGREEPREGDTPRAVEPRREHDAPRTTEGLRTIGGPALRPVERAAPPERGTWGPDGAEEAPPSSDRARRRRRRGGRGRNKGGPRFGEAGYGPSPTREADAALDGERAGFVNALEDGDDLDGRELRDHRDPPRVDLRATYDELPPLASNLDYDPLPEL